MKKRVLSSILAIVLLLALASTFVLAETSVDTVSSQIVTTSKVKDDANILSISVISKAEARFKELEQKYGYDVRFFSVNGISNTLHDEAVNAVKSTGGTTGNTLVMFVNMSVMNSDNRGFIVIAGDESNISTDTCTKIVNKVKPYMSDEDFDQAVMQFADCAETVMANGGKFPFDFTEYIPAILIALLGGLVFGIIMANGQKKKVNPVAIASEANEYLVPGSLNIRNKNEMFLYSTVTKVAKKTSSGTSSSSGGGFHGSSSSF